MDWVAVGIFAASVVFAGGVFVGKVRNGKYVPIGTFNEWRAGFEKLMDERHTAVMKKLEELSYEVKKWQ